MSNPYRGAYAVPNPNSPTAVAVPVPGIPGPPGQGGVLTPEQVDELSEEVGVEIIADLEPPVNLVLLFENGLA